MPSNLVDNMKWDDLSMAERTAYIKLGLDNNITDLKVVRDTYNKYAEGGPLNPYSAGSLVDAIYKNSKREEYLGKPSHHYDFTISEEEANRLGYYPNERGHRDDRVKKPAHPTHPSRGKWNSFEEFELTDRGMENPNYTLFGLNDGGQDPQAVMTYRGGIVLPEITVTPKKNYIHNPYDNINIYAEGGLMDDPPTENEPIKGPPAPPMGVSALNINDEIVIPRPKPKPQENLEFFNERTTWHENWLSQRKDILLKNIEDAREYKLNYIEKGLPIIGETFNLPKDAEEGYTKLISNLRNTLEIYNPETDLYHRLLPPAHDAVRTLLSYRDLKDKTKAQKSALKMGEEAADEFSISRSFTGMRKKEYGETPIIYYPIFPKRSTMIHERTHALDANPLEFEILRTINEKGKSLYRDNVTKDDYYDSPTEIYSRMNELRYMFKLDPKKKYNTISDMLEGFRNDKGKIDEDKLKELMNSPEWKDTYNRYNRDVFFHWLNNVAQNNTFITGMDSNYLG